MNNNRLFDRKRLKFQSLSRRKSKINISSILPLDSPLPAISEENREKINMLAYRIKQARKKNAAVILLYGAHLFRNGLSLFINNLMEKEYISHLVTNGAGVIHDWEMAYSGATTEDVAEYISKGQFGIWEETGFYQNLAVLLGAAEGSGYGEAIGKMINDDQLVVPSAHILQEQIETEIKSNSLSAALSSKIALLRIIKEFGIDSKKYVIEHKHKKNSIVYNAWQSGVPFSVCPGIGYDIIYTHPINCGTAFGEAAVTDFLKLVNSTSNLENGVIIVAGSAVMASQVIEKALSMVKNAAAQSGNLIENYHITVSDIQPGNWDWSKGEPPKNNPAYYLRFCKSFSRLGGNFSYLQLDNRIFIQHLYHQLYNY